MKELVKKVDLFESMINEFAESYIDRAYDAFTKKHGYDLRKLNNEDYLIFSNWEIEDKNLILEYLEITPHDCAGKIELEYKLSDLSINCI